MSMHDVSTGMHISMCWRSEDNLVGSSYFYVGSANWTQVDRPEATFICWATLPAQDLLLMAHFFGGSFYTFSTFTNFWEKKSCSSRNDFTGKNKRLENRRGYFCAVSFELFLLKEHLFI